MISLPSNPEDCSRPAPHGTWASDDTGHYETRPCLRRLPNGNFLPGFELSREGGEPITRWGSAIAGKQHASDAARAMETHERQTDQNTYIPEFVNVDLTIVGVDVYLSCTADPAAHFSSHRAAFEASCRFHDRAWQPVFSSAMTENDNAQLEHLRRCACVTNPRKEDTMSLTSRNTRLMNYLLDMRHYSIDQLIPVVREQRHPQLKRIAALRWLMDAAPLDVTQGASYCTRRRFVRRHYRV
jgi:hypothetical protein